MASLRDPTCRFSHFDAISGMTDRLTDGQTDRQTHYDNGIYRYTVLSINRQPVLGHLIVPNLTTPKNIYFPRNIYFFKYKLMISSFENLISGV